VVEFRNPDWQQLMATMTWWYQPNIWKEIDEVCQRFDMTYSKHKPPQGPSINIITWPLQKRAAEGVDDEGRPSKK
jgi:hypothetical protein